MKKEKGGIFPEKVWKDKLFNWVKDNAPESITANMKESVNEINEVKEPEVISQLRDIVKGKQNKKIKDPKSGKMMRVDLYSASAITKVYDAINKSNKDKFGKLSLPKMVNVAFSVIKKESVNEVSGEFVTYIEKDNGRKKLLRTSKSQRAANMFMIKHMDNLLNKSGIRSIGTGCGDAGRDY